MRLINGGQIVEGTPEELAAYARHVTAPAVDPLAAELAQFGRIGYLHVCASCRSVAPSPVWLRSRACGGGCGPMAVLGRYDLGQPEATQALLALTAGPPR